MTMHKIINLLRHPSIIAIFLASKNIIYLPDRLFIKLLYKYRMQKKINIDNPKTFNEKLQWLKLYDRKPEYTKMVDKYDVKNYIKEKIGDNYIIPTLGIYNRFDEIDFDLLPKQFVIKCTHDSGGIIVVNDKKDINKNLIEKKLNKGLKKNYYYTSREWPYKKVIPRIIIEKYLGDNLTDYRFYCFNSKPEFVYVYINESQNDGSKPEPNHCNIYNMNWKKQSFRNKYTPCNKVLNKPLNFELMKEISQKLAIQTSFLRVDFYEVDKKLYIGELTFFPGSGFSKFYPEQVDEILGKKLNLPEKKIKNEK